MTVLRAAPRLDRDDSLDLHLGSAPPHAHLVGKLKRIADRVVGEAEHLEHLFLVQPDAPFEHVLTRRLENGAHARTSREEASRPAPASSAARTSASISWPAGPRFFVAAWRK